ncbi:hypothetical protein TEP_18220 [Stenotrophomonas sp. TEPEL]|nr:hypothetical protein TEP_18220 [Stenotrophomonas sp. TEPEL]
MPLCDVRSRVKSISSDISEQYRQEFIDVSLVAYSSAGAFFDAQKQRLQQYFAKDISRSTHSSPPGYKAEEVREVNLSLQRPSFVHQDVWSALQRVRKVTGLVWCVVVPLGVVDGRESCFDILLCHQPVESINSATNGMLWEISSELGRNNVLMRFVSGSLAPTQMYSMVSSHILSIGRDYGEACLGRRVFLQLAE